MPHAQDIRHAPRRSRSLPGALGAVALAAIAWSFPGTSGTLYKCEGAEGIPSYVSQKMPGAKCTEIHYANAPRGNASTPAAASVASSSTPSGVPGPTALPPLTTQRVGVIDFGDPNAASALSPLHVQGQRFHYVQLGDSHTAGDFMTGRLRARLQARIGDGGAGWASPVRVSGQRLDSVGFEQSGWDLQSSRRGEPADYPAGGLIARPSGPRAELQLSVATTGTPHRVTLLVQQQPMDAPLVVTDASGKRIIVASPVADGSWQAAEFVARLPLRMVAEAGPGTSIGGWWLSGQAPGALVSAIGINGSRLAQRSRWRSGWLQDLAPARPDVIALAYGTNEAFDDTLDPEETRRDVASAVAQIRERFPAAAVLIIGAPESLIATSGTCGVRAPSLDAVQRIQREVAAAARTLYWDAQAAMGGRCSMKRWAGEALARKDGVHFTSDGYARLGDALYQGLVEPGAPGDAD
ncbi:GDSL-type esterase/lipase family protein [Luteimonas sp. MC1750]|uniref:GDSL-type esterase/lipase family protein n=1 Tax=Luteimonas sp. MC1750 TaxID=2799326 RepID=UPI0018F0AA05|nr:GDSL-type esterase/lipase family protein [Luteimonas sp. MC1750]MBJ6984197.1 hypothetical protein [Luteimonas sp. MC1750]QQO07015.1 hypothetical protein JGR68_06255 [Luteimonas sp. MC1750]